MRKSILVYNPVAGDHGTAGRLDYIIDRFQSRDFLLQPYRLSPEAFSKLPDVISSGGYESVICSGGDGSLNFTANILLKSGLDIPMGIIPAGTCNDFARSLGIPSSIESCIDIVLAGKNKSVDVGLLNEKEYFLGTLAGGHFVNISFSTHHELKRNFGPFAYYLKGISEMANIKGFKIKLNTETQSIEEKVLFFIILNGTEAAGFSGVVRDADLSDGLMDILLVKNCSHIDLGGLFFKVLSHDSLNDRHLIKLRAKTCEIHGKSDIAVSVDGEKGPQLPLSVRFLYKALKVFVK